MKSASRFLAVVALACAAAVASAEDPARGPPADVVTWTEDGATKTRTGVVVESAGFDQVVFTQGGRRTTLDGADVVDVKWGDAPREFESAVAALRDGDADGARAGFDAVLRARATPRAWLVERGALGLGEAWLALAAWDVHGAEKAAHAFETARGANARSLVLDRILGGLVKAEILRGRADAAVTAADEFEAASRTAKRPLWACQAALLRSRALEARGDVAGALRAIEDAVARADGAAEATKDADLARRLRSEGARAFLRKIWLAIAEAETSRAAEAADRARKLLLESASRGSGDAEADAARTNAAGALLLLGGDAKRALRKFIETDVAHFDVPEEAARALWYEAQCQERLDDKPARAEALRRLVEEYPESEWARRAR